MTITYLVRQETCLPWRELAIEPMALRRVFWKLLLECSLGMVRISIIIDGWDEFIHPIRVCCDSRRLSLSSAAKP
jgi:hypothetical protein